jgi:hypothetical protein
MRKACFLVVVLFTIVITSCKKDMAYGGDYALSYRSWLDFKDSSGNSYRYKVVSGSWTGYGTETIITVKKGKVVERSFVAKAYANNGTNTINILEQWTEDESQLSSHEKGAALRTMDEIYQLAKTDWLQKRDDATTYFEAKNHGLISSCGYVPNGCADDCFQGISIDLIEGI